MCTFSDEHILFLKRKRKEWIFINTFRLLILIFFIIIWELLAKFSIINAFLFSSPSKIMYTIYNLFINGELLSHIIVTLYEVLLSFFIASFLGIIIAYLLWKNEILSKIIDPYLTIINSLPKVALGPLIIIWVGSSIKSIIFMALLISVFITIINIYLGFASVNDNYITLLKSFGATKKQIFFKVILPSNYLNIISSFKINISMSLIGVIMGELLVSKRGIGYLIMYGSQVFNIDLVISGVFILAIFSYLMYFIIEKVQYYYLNKTN